MNNRIIAGAVFAAVMLPCQAMAAPVITFNQSSSAFPPGRSATIFRNFESAPDSGAPYVPAAGEAVTGDVRVYSSTSDGLAVDPDTENGNHFLSILNGSYSVAFATPVQFFSFVIGSVDNYNNLVLGFANGTTQSYTGRQIIGDSVIGPFNSTTWGRVSYDLGGQPGIVSATFSSTRAALEIDDLATAVPEAGTWAMMLLGLGAVGYAMRRRQSVATRVRFA